MRSALVMQRLNHTHKEPTETFCSVQEKPWDEAGIDRTLIGGGGDNWAMARLTTRHVAPGKQHLSRLGLCLLASTRSSPAAVLLLTSSVQKYHLHPIYRPLALRLKPSFHPRARSGHRLLPPAPGYIPEASSVDSLLTSPIPR